MGRSSVISNINQALPTNGNDEISAQDLRGVLITDVVNKFMNLEDDAEIPVYNPLISYKLGKLVLNQDVIWRALVNVLPNQIPPTLPATSNTYWKLQETTSLGRVGRVLFVSKGGDNTTAVVGSQSLSYLTIQAALNASTSGDIIHVFAGIYTENLTITTTSQFSNGLKLILGNGVIINGNVNFLGNGGIGWLSTETYLGATINGNIGLSSGTYMMLMMSNLVINGNIDYSVRIASWKNNWITNTAGNAWTAGGNFNIDNLGYKCEFIDNRIFTNFELYIEANQRLLIEKNYFQGTVNSDGLVYIVAQDGSFKDNTVINLGTGYALRCTTNTNNIKFDNCTIKTAGTTAIFVLFPSGNRIVSLTACKLQATTYAISGTGTAGTHTVLNVNCISNVQFIESVLNLVDTPYNQNVIPTFTI